MLDRYGRIEPTEANELVLQAFGKLEEEAVAEPLTKPKTYPRCRNENDALSKYCRVCGMVLDEKEDLRREVVELCTELSLVKEGMEFLADPDIITSLKELKRQVEKG